MSTYAINLSSQNLKPFFKDLGVLDKFTKFAKSGCKFAQSLIKSFGESLPTQKSIIDQLGRSLSVFTHIKYGCSVFKTMETATLLYDSCQRKGAEKIDIALTSIKLVGESYALINDTRLLLVGYLCTKVVEKVISHVGSALLLAGLVPFTAKLWYDLYQNKEAAAVQGDPIKTSKLKQERITKLILAIELTITVAATIFALIAVLYLAAEVVVPIVAVLGLIAAGLGIAGIIRKHFLKPEAPASEALKDAA